MDNRISPHDLAVPPRAPASAPGPPAQAAGPSHVEPLPAERHDSAALELQPTSPGEPHPGEHTAALAADLDGAVASLQAVNAAASATDGGRDRLNEVAATPRLAALQPGIVAQDSHPDLSNAWLSTLRETASTAEAFTRLEAAAVQTPSGVDATSRLLAEADAVSLEGIHAAAATTPAGRLALGQLYDAAATCPALGTALMQLDNTALRSDAGAHACADLRREAAASPALANCLLRQETAALSTPHSRDLVAATLDLAAQREETAVARAQLEASAARTPQNGALPAFLAAAARAPAAAAAVLRNDATAATTARGAGLLVERNTALAAHPEGAAAWQILHEAALTTEAGRACFAATLQEAAHQPALAASNLGVAAAAAHDAGGARALTSVYRSAASDDRLARLHVEAENAALQTPAGRNAANRLARAEAAFPQLATARAAVAASVISQARAGAPGAATAWAEHEAAWRQPDLATASLQRDVALLQTERGRQQVEQRLAYVAGHPVLAAVEVERLSHADAPSVIAWQRAVSRSPALAATVAQIGASAAAAPEGRKALGDTIWVGPSTDRPDPATLEATHQIASLARQCATPAGAAQIADDWRVAARMPEAAHERVATLALALQTEAGREHCVTLLAQAADQPSLAASLEALQQAAARAPGGTDAVNDFVDQMWEHPETARAWRALPRATLNSPPAPAWMSLPITAVHRLTLQAMPPAAWPERDASDAGDGSHGQQGPLRLDAPHAVRSHAVSRPHDEGDDDAGAKAVRDVGPHGRMMAPQQVRGLEPIQAVSLFDMGDARRRRCSRCGASIESRAPACPACNSAQRERLISSMNTIQRSGYVIGHEIDAVEVTTSARQALEEGGTFVSIRKAPLFVRYRDLLEISSPSTAGYAVVRQR